MTRQGVAWLDTNRRHAYFSISVESVLKGRPAQDFNRTLLPAFSSLGDTLL